MAVPQSSAHESAGIGGVSLTLVGAYPGLRALAWHDDVLYASQGYKLLRAKIGTSLIEWESVAEYHPSWWRNLTSAWRLSSRFFRDGFHALAVLASGHIVAAVPGAILTLKPGENEFLLSHKVIRGTRPLHITATPKGHIYWGEYFDNPQRDEVHIYVSTDHGEKWNIAYTFHKGTIRHVHNIVYDEWQDCLWVFTGDNGPECRILRASSDFRNVEVVLSGNQQARAVAAVPTQQGLYFSSDTPFEVNHVYRLDPHSELTALASLGSSSIYGCRVEEAIFFSTMVEPSAVNSDQNVRLYSSLDGTSWDPALAWKKDHWSMKLFQYGNAFLPDGRNTSGFLAVSTIAVKGADLETSLWQVNS